jgi:selenocysteine lyase/cysteine desulfurase
VPLLHDHPNIIFKFLALKHRVIFFDNPGGTQVAQPVLDRMNPYLVEHNAKHGDILESSRAIVRTWQPGDEIVVTRLDHDANITPWVMAAEDRGCTVRWGDFHLEGGTLDLKSFQKAMDGCPRLKAFSYVSNVLGTINPVAIKCDVLVSGKHCFQCSVASLAASTGAV